MIEQRTVFVFAGEKFDTLQKAQFSEEVSKLGEKIYNNCEGIHSSEDALDVARWILEHYTLEAIE
jgi:hypothetical protein